MKNWSKETRIMTTRSFCDDKSGMTGAIFGLSLIPVMLMIGAAADYTKATSMRAALLQATDTAALTVAAKLSSSSTNAIAKTQAQTIINAQPNMASATVISATVSNDKSSVCVTAKTTVQTAFMQVGGFGSLTPRVTSCANSAAGIDVNTTFEIALVLDNSGSMSGTTGTTTKMQALKSAATSFVNTMFEKAPGRVKMTVTPFAGAVVAVDPTQSANRALPWIDTAGNNSQHWVAFGGKSAANTAGFTNRFQIFDKLKLRNAAMDWRGCFESPVYPLNVQDMAISTNNAETLFVPYLAPDEPVYYQNNNYLDDGGYNGTGSTSSSSSYSCTSTQRAATDNWSRLTRVCKYNQTATLSGSFGPYDSYGNQNAFGPNAFCPNHTTQRVLRMTDTKATITNKINQLVEAGNTNLHEGFMWGWRTISPVGPFADGRSYSAENNRKIMIFMTDGFNNWSAYPNYYRNNVGTIRTVVGSDYESLGYYTYNGNRNLRLPEGSKGDRVDYQALLTSSKDTSTSYKPTSRLAQDDLTSQACENAKAAGIEVFTIGFSTSSDPIDAQGLNLMQGCATNAEHYFPVTNVSQLNAAFSAIGTGLGKLRLTQ